MKKSLLLSFLAACLVAMAAGAQPVQKIMGHYTSDSISQPGYAMSTSGTFALAVMLDPDELEMYMGGNVVAIRVGLSESAEISQVFLIPVLSAGRYGEKVYWNCEMSQAGWNTFELPDPYELNLEEGQKLLVGFNYKQVTGAHPLSLVKVGQPYDTYTLKKTGSTSRWKEVGFINDGNLAVQCIVEKDSYPDYIMRASRLQTVSTIEAGQPLPFTLEVNNRGIKDIDAGGLTLNVCFDGEQVATVTNETPFDGGYCTIDTTVPTDGLGSGEHTLTVELAAVDGQPLEEPIVLETTFLAYRMSFPRQKHLIEQLTSTYCTYCPLGINMLSLLTSMRDDLIWVGIHGNLGTGVDPFRSDQADSIMAYMTGGSISYPSGAFDRTIGWSDDENIVGGLGYYEQYHQEVAEYFDYFFDYISDTRPTFAEVNADCWFNTETRMATVSVHGKVSPDFDFMVGEDSRLVVYILEDSLVAPQLDSGTWRPQFTHNGVFRQALGSIKGEPLNRTDGRYKNVYRFAVPAAWNWNNLRVVAFICRPITNYTGGFGDMWVNNANDFKFQISDAVTEVNVDGDAVPVAYYDLTGRQTNGLQPGINIVKMSDGSTRKLLVK